MNTDGMIALANALTELAQVHNTTQLLAGENTINTSFNYLTLVTSWSSKLTGDQEKCSAYTESSTVGNETDAIEATIWRGTYQSDSIDMNKEIGKQNALLNTEQMQMNIQSQNLTPVYSVLEYVSLLFLTTSGLLTH